MAEPVVLCLSRSGETTAHRVATALGASVHGREGRVEAANAFFPNALDHTRDLFAAGVPVIGVCAAGILIRAVAPLLNDKAGEPPVVAVADDGSSVVPLLGGHRGANRLAREIAAALDGHAAVTTAGDVALGLALDEPPDGWVLENPEAAKATMAALLAGGGASVGGDEAAKATWLDALPRGEAVEILATMDGSVQAAARPTLVYRPQRVTLGVGCARDCPPEELAALVRRTLDDLALAPAALKGVFTLDLKADERAVIELAASLGLPMRVFDAPTLEALTPRLENPSDVVFAEVGCHGVAEAAALAGGGEAAVLWSPKVKSANATCAVAVTPEPIAGLRGRKRGRVSLVGIGPGRVDWRTPEASRMVAEADDLVGYGLYIDLLGPLAQGKPRHDFPLGGEAARCRYALEKAGEGRDVALVCSGDAGIYAMGALVFELLDRGEGLSDAARRVEVVTTPGVTAMQAAAARIGAPLGHDFCAISLSDLLTPREDILRRIRAAAEGDFVVSFYNPVSKTRRTLLAEARAILLEHRPPETPVLLARDLGRPDEALTLRTLETLSVDEVDMLTVVVVGSSQSRVTSAGRMYTPRGYARKERLDDVG